MRGLGAGAEDRHARERGVRLRSRHAGNRHLLVSLPFGLASQARRRRTNRAQGAGATGSVHLLEARREAKKARGSARQHGPQKQGLDVREEARGEDGDGGDGAAGEDRAEGVLEVRRGSVGVFAETKRECLHRTTVGPTAQRKTEEAKEPETCASVLVA